MSMITQQSNDNSPEFAIAREMLRLRPQIEKALKKLKLYTFEQLTLATMAGDFILFSSAKEFLLLSIERFPLASRACVFLASGDPTKEEIYKLLSLAEQHAKRIGATEIYATVRPAVDKLGLLSKHNGLDTGWKRGTICYLKEL